jgi:MFS family permease
MRIEYKWVALSNTTLGMLVAMINSSILLIALPDIFRGIGVNPLDPGNTSYLLWLILGFLVIMAVLLVSLGRLGDIYGRPFATGGMLIAAASFALLIVLPVGFSYAWFALILFMNGIGMGLFTSPNSAGVMNSLPPARRGAGAGMLATFSSSAAVLSIGVFFSLMIVGLSSGLPSTLQHGLAAHGVPAADAARVAHLPPVATLFASFLGYNPVRSLLGPHVLGALPRADAQALTGSRFFPHLISGPFHTALVYAFSFAIVACLVAAVASLLRGGKYHFEEQRAPQPVAGPAYEALGQASS